MLRRWGEGLTNDEREEVRAAGRAILLLADEVEQLHVDLWHARDHAVTAEAEGEEEHAPSADGTSLGSTLRQRLAAFRPSKAE
jgi:hypothetical protein